MTPRDRDDGPIASSDPAESLMANYRARVVELEQRLDDLTRLVSDLVWDVDENLRLTYISERVFDILGFIPQELTGKSIFELGTFEDEAAISAPDVFRRAFRNRRYIINDKQGRAHNFRISGIPLVTDVDRREAADILGDTEREEAEAILSMR